ncbi:MAG: hypothetical protein CMK35_05120 [Porticoccaceae bacterium]|nr:hypothetical protein [Porticoccaceae bacterium]
MFSHFQKGKAIVVLATLKAKLKIDLWDFEITLERICTHKEVLVIIFSHAFLICLSLLQIKKVTV